MNQFLPKSFARQLLIFYQENEVRASHFSNKKWLQIFIENGILVKRQIGKRQFRIQCLSIERLEQFVNNQFGIKDLVAYTEINETTNRSEATQIATNSKATKKKVFQGIWINTFQNIEAELNEKKINLQPQEGVALFVHQYQKLTISPEIIIVGIENAENFTAIHQQRYLFPTENQYLFTYRDTHHAHALKDWLSSISNPYWHFGDIDLAGIAIFENEFLPYLGQRAKLFVPEGTEHLLKTGSPYLYNQQFQKYKYLKGQTTETKDLVELIHHHRRCVEQEIFIKPIP